MRHSNSGNGTKLFYISLLTVAIVLTTIGIISVSVGSDSGQNKNLASNENDTTESGTNPVKPPVISPELENNEMADKDKTTTDSTDSEDQTVNQSMDQAIPDAPPQEGKDAAGDIAGTQDTHLAQSDTATSTSENQNNTEHSKPEIATEASESSEAELADSSATSDASSTFASEDSFSEEASDPALEVFSPDGTTSEAAQSSLHFDQGKGLLWPITGDVILNYSMEEAVYFKTLGQYKCNPAILIAGKKNTPVYAACDGVVESVEANDETGQTITCSAGDDYQVVYGQLKNITVKPGDRITRGQTLGKLAKPSNSYVLEGNHLFFEVLENGAPVDPMLLLK